jgi:hypothetical protein
MRLLYLNRSNKVWLISSLLVLFFNLIVFVFRKHFDRNMVLIVVLLTPVAWAGLYFLSKLFFKSDLKN